MSKLTDKQEAFCREYIIDFNASQAALRSGYSAATVGSIGHENIKKPEIQARLAELIEQRNERTQYDADYVLRQAVKIHEWCMQQFNANGAIKSLELIGKHVGVQAFKENVNHSGEIGINWNEQRTYETKHKTD